MTNEPLTELRFWAQVLTDAERAVICSPENESRIKCWIDARGVGGIIKVMACQRPVTSPRWRPDS